MNFNLLAGREHQVAVDVLVAEKDLFDNNALKLGNFLQDKVTFLVTEKLVRQGGCCRLG